MDILDTVFDLFRLHGGEAYGEDVTQLTHALQCAHFAAHDGAPDALVGAALIHDVGHFLHDAAGASSVDGWHEERGAAFLAPYFAEEVVAPIRLHVAAKRYLCATEPGYRAGLSHASEQSLQLQGGVFSAEEAEAFRRLPHGEAAIRLRRYDDLGKLAELETAPLESYRPLLRSLMSVGLRA